MGEIAIRQRQAAPKRGKLLVVAENIPAPSAPIAAQAARVLAVLVPALAPRVPRAAGERARPVPALAPASSRPVASRSRSLLVRHEVLLV
jgi:hypothetical protein